MARNKIVLGGEVLIDLTQDTITKEKLLKGITAHGADGEPITGTCEYDVDSSDATAVIAEVLNGKTFGKGGKILTGTMPNNGAVSGEISTKDGKYQVPQGYHDGSGTVGISQTEKNKIIASNIRKGVEILGVTGSMDSTEGVNAQSKEVTPTMAEQTIIPDSGYNYLTQVKVKAIPVVETDNAAGGKTVTIG
jgi:hypothetical protein